MSENKREIHMSTRQFLEEVIEESGLFRRYCFILGSGASITSGIPSGLKLMPKWQEYLRKKGADNIRNRAKKAIFRMKNGNRCFKRGMNSKVRTTSLCLTFAMRVPPLSPIVPCKN